MLAAYGIAGERVVVEVREEHPTHIVAEVVEVLRASPERVEPRCPHFGVCGGCQLQHISYEEQGKIKQQVLADQLRQIGGIVNPPVSPILAAENPWNYRNNARFTVRREGVTGFTHWHTHRFEPIDECLIMDTRINDIKRKLDGALINRERQLAVRIGKNTGETLVHPALNEIGDERGVETGQLSYTDRLFNTPFKVSAASFFQVNTAQAERMIALVRDRLRPAPSDTIVDAYAGVGTIAALLAPMCGRVIAIEESAAAVRDAEINLAPFPNVEMILAKTEEALPKLKERVDAVILDPPRQGCYPEVIDALRRLQPRRIVYVSCDPATLARDLNRLILGGYTLTDVTPVDMFPHTYHIESVSTLEKTPPQRRLHPRLHLNPPPRNPHPPKHPLHHPNPRPQHRIRHTPTRQSRPPARQSRPPIRHSRPPVRHSHHPIRHSRHPGRNSHHPTRNSHHPTRHFRAPLRHSRERGNLNLHSATNPRNAPQRCRGASRRSPPTPQPNPLRPKPGPPKSPIRREKRRHRPRSRRRHNRRSPGRPHPQQTKRRR